jgi:hypothetical protein
VSWQARSKTHSHGAEANQEQWHAFTRKRRSHNIGYFRYFLSLIFTNPQNKFFQIVQILALVSIPQLCCFCYYSSLRNAGGNGRRADPNWLGVQSCLSLPVQDSVVATRRLFGRIIFTPVGAYR